jgi:hypothetical protein
MDNDFGKSNHSADMHALYEVSIFEEVETESWKGTPRHLTSSNLNTKAMF